jgi:hypothetical protein
VFRISVLELGLTCALIVLAFVIPLIVSRGYAQLNERLKNLENRFTKKK